MDSIMSSASNKCITCQTYPINEMISPNFCSQLCKMLYLRSDLEFISMDALKNIALAYHNQLEKAGIDSRE